MKKFFHEVTDFLKIINLKKVTKKLNMKKNDKIKCKMNTKSKKKTSILHLLSS